MLQSKYVIYISCNKLLVKCEVNRLQTQLISCINVYIMEVSCGQMAVDVIVFHNSDLFSWLTLKTNR